MEQFKDILVAIDKLKTQVPKNEYAKQLQEQTISNMYGIVLEDYAESVSIRFGRWLLKNAKEHWSEGLLCWLHEGKEYNTDELFEVFKKENLNC